MGESLSRSVRASCECGGNCPPWDCTSVLACGEVELAPIILEDAGVPPYVGSPHHDNLRPVLTIARSLAPRKAIEMGTSYGNLAANICRQFPSATVYTVNALPDQQTGGITTHSLTGDQIGRVYLAYRLLLPRSANSLQYA